MTAPTALSLGVIAAGCAAALVAYRLDRRVAYGVAKGVASAAFVATAVSVGATGATWSTVALAALVFSALGDVALAVPGKKGFLAGLGLFALAHIAYSVAFLVLEAPGPLLAMTSIASVAFVAGAWLVFRRKVPPSLAAPVGAYFALLALMIATGTAAGIASGRWLLAVGAVLVAGSDIAVARHRFGTPGFSNKLVGLPVYYIGQTLIALALG